MSTLRSALIVDGAAHRVDSTAARIRPANVTDMEHSPCHANLRPSRSRHGRACPRNGVPVATNDTHDAARQLAHQIHHVVWVAGRRPWRDFLRWISRGRFGRGHSSPALVTTTGPWQDTPSAEREGWRERAAVLNGEVIFAVDYQICQQCGLGWVELPHTDPSYQRCGLARAALTAVRTENPGLSWHTLGGQSDAPAFWNAAGAQTRGGYRRHPLCPHI
jgi:hypothetical protein